MKGDHLGEFEELTLLSVKALGEPVYAVPIQRFIARAAGREVAMGAVYSALGRLEAKGLLRSTAGEATGERGGKRRRLFVITPAGMRQLRNARRVRDRIWKLIEEEG